MDWLQRIREGATKVRNFVFPSAQSIYERKQQEAKQSLILTPELKREIRREQAGFAVDRPTDTPEEFFSKTVLGPPEFMGLVRSIETKLVNRIAQETDAGKITTLLKRFIPEMGKDVDVSGLASKLAKENKPPRIRFEINQLISRAQKVAQEAEGVATKELSERLRERGFVTSAKTVVPEAEKIAGQYIPRATDKLSKMAANLLTDDPVSAERILTSETTDRSVAIASEYIKKLGIQAERELDPQKAQALYDKVAEIANDMAVRLTEAGRTVQAASILGRMTPEGQLRFAARTIQKYNQENPAKKIPELSGEQSSFIISEMKAIRDMEDSLERAMRYKKLQDYISDIVPTPLWKKITAVWKAGLLTGIKTSGLNLFSNITHNLMEIGKDIPASMVDSAASLFTGERAKTLTIRQAFEGIKEGSVKGVRYFSTGFDERNIGLKLDYRRVNFGKGAVAKAFQTYTDTVFRALSVGDQPFYYATLSRSMMDQALANGKNLGLSGDELLEHAYKLVEEPTEEMVRIGTADAATAVFLNDTVAGQAAMKIQSLPGGEFIIPFGRTPSAVAMQAIRYSPIGLVVTLAENIGKGRFNQRAFSEGVGRGLFGTGIMYLGMELAKNGMFAGKYPIGDEKEQKLQEAEGVRAGYILIDGKWRNPLVLGPAGVLLQAGAFLEQALATSGSPTEAMTKAIADSSKAFLELPFLTGLQDFTNMVMDPERYAKGYLPNLAASFVPTIVSDVARATDSLERRTETTVDRIKSRLPGLRKDLEPKVTILGDPLERGGNAIETLIDPTRPSEQTETPVTMELRRLTNVGHRVSPTALGGKNGYASLTKEENTILWQKTGELIDTKLTSLFSKDAYIKLPDDQKAKVVEQVVSRSKLVTRATLAIKVTEGLSGEELKKKLAELKEDELLTRDVFEVYKQLR